ncbi:MarR family transcriptional regulator [Dyella sp. 2HG41-7]|uniref:MarR family transcriptional regulator n=1 Tax=Dyella sp. 2HG41-7 TaxID=2883239 RepID=UPI001F3A6A9C|nr:MarR family transcriptional regulator [Dyella sp. 2HG41-7]
MSVLSAVEQNAAVLCRRHPEVPFEWVLALRLIVHICHQVNGDASTFLRAWNITYDEYLVLSSLYTDGEGALPISTLSRLLGSKPADVNRSVRQLAAKQMIRRIVGPANRRMGLFALTDEGKKALEQCLPVMGGMLAHAGRQFEEGEIVAVAQSLKKLFREPD